MYNICTHTHTHSLAGEVNQTRKRCSDTVLSLVAPRVFPSPWLSFPNCCVTILVCYTSLPTLKTRCLWGPEFLQELKLRNREMTKDPLPWSSQEEIQLSLSGPLRIYWTDWSTLGRRSVSTGISRHLLFWLSRITLKQNHRILSAAAPQNWHWCSLLISG